MLQGTCDSVVAERAMRQRQLAAVVDSTATLQAPDAQRSLGHEPGGVARRQRGGRGGAGVVRRTSLNPSHCTRRLSFTAW